MTDEPFHSKSGWNAIERHSNDPVQEALNRDEFEMREAHGTVGGKEVLLVASLDRGRMPKLTVWGGGELVEYEEDDIEDEYTGGETREVGFENVHALTREFERLCSEYELEVRD